MLQNQQNFIPGSNTKNLLICLQEKADILKEFWSKEAYSPSDFEEYLGTAESFYSFWYLNKNFVLKLRMQNAATIHNEAESVMFTN